MTGIIALILELCVLLFKTYMGLAADKAKQDELMRAIQDKCTAIAVAAEELMRERNRKDQAGSGNMQDDMDKELKSKPPT